MNADLNEQSKAAEATAGLFPPKEVAMPRLVKWCLVLVLALPLLWLLARPLWWRDEVSVPRPQGPPPKMLTNSIGMKLVLIPAGKFIMGASPDEIGFRPCEGP